MKKIIFCISIWLLNLPAFALDYNDFPPDLQKILDERITALASNGGICVAGRITTDDGTQFKGGNEVMINLLAGADEPLWVYKDGWFIMGRVFSSDHSERGSKLMLRSFEYDPIDADITLLQGKITYAEFVMHVTPAEKLASVSGKVVNDKNEPVEGAYVGLGFPFSNHGYRGDIGDTFPHLQMTTDKDGRYSFEHLSVSNFSITASKKGYAYHSVHFTPSPGKAEKIDLKLYRHRKITIDYVYQPDGSRSFTGNNLKSGTIEWVNGNNGLYFSDGAVKEYDPKTQPDLNMRQEQETVIFQNFYGNGQGNGFYEAEEMSLESIVEASEKDYSSGGKPCLAGHTYVVRTYDNKYAKFIVKDISWADDKQSAQ